VQEFESGNDFGSVKPGSVLFKSSALLNVEHQVAPVQILHHKEQVGLLNKFRIIFRLIQFKKIFNSPLFGKCRTGGTDKDV
jgi:hypothetical protein